MQGQGIDTRRCRSQPLPTAVAPGYQNPGGGGAASWVGPAQPEGAESACAVAGCSTFKAGKGILSPASGAAAAEPSLWRTVRGEAGRNVGTVPGVAASLRCWGKVLSSQPGSFVTSPVEGIGPPRQAPTPALSPASPSPASLRTWDHPWDQEEGKLLTFRILQSTGCVALGWLLPTLGANLPA